MNLTENPQGQGPLDIQRILSLLPHRYPLVMVDRVTEIILGKSIRGHKCVAFNEPWFQGHFPDRPIMPGVLILEALAQIGGVLAGLSDSLDHPPKAVYFLGIDKARFRHPVTPGDRLDLHVETIHRRSKVWKMQGQANTAGQLCAEGEILIMVGDKL
jgi:3-hydroxyacyl-[acyl-carrier-protein] dehydratase